MRLCRFVDTDGHPQVGLVEGDVVRTVPLAGSPFGSLADLLATPDCAAAIGQLVPAAAPAQPLDTVQWLPPIDRQEVWAAGVTYKRSRAARMEESVAAASVYDRVYEADRPELFLKATPHRVAGHQQPLRIRRDSSWNVPEPELTLVLDPRLRIVGYTVGNDMSSRDIEGENPLYLPQAKVYDACCGLGPWITLACDMPPRQQIDIELVVERAGGQVFRGTTSIAQMARSLEGLVDYLGRDQTFPDGAFLLTGTGIVPDSDFTLHPGDMVHITISGIGTLSNPVVQAT
jgi:2-dehydro-3-deoxy-D-arabinonate dehydratase